MAQGPRTITDIPQANLAFQKSLLESEGFEVEVRDQGNGLFTLIASMGAEQQQQPQSPGDEIPPEGRALLDAIAEHESAGHYDVIFGGQRFTDFSHHPNIPVPIPGRPGLVSTAAGRYQFLFSTWTIYQNKLHLPDFSPASQDKAAWALAQADYHTRTHGDLLSDLRSGDLSKIGPGLHDTWTSLPGGSEQGVGFAAFQALYKSKLMLITAQSGLEGDHSTDF
jgi:muramidase (phage lysozyme)